MLYYSISSVYSRTFTATHLGACPCSESLSPLEANGLSLPPFGLCYPPFYFRSLGCLTALRSPCEWAHEVCLVFQLSWRIIWIAPGPRILFLVETEWFSCRQTTSPSLSLDAKQVVKIPSYLGQILHEVLQGALKEHSGIPQVYYSHSLPSVSLSCPASSASQDPDHKAK